MRYMATLSLLFFLSSITALETYAQDDEVRQGTGLPMQIGENLRAGNRMNVSGRISVENVRALKRPPVITVIVNVSGTMAERTIANDTGYFLLRNVPRDNATLIVEVDGIETVRHPIIAPPMGNPRFDFTIAWPPSVPTDAKPGVISATRLFPRSAKNDELFQKAVAATHANETAKAVDFFNQVLSSEPKDFVAWTELGTLYFKANSLDNAEACYFKAIELKKDFDVALLNLGMLYFSRKQYDNAILVLSNAVNASPDSADAHHYLGESYLQSKKGSSAVFHLNEAIRLSPVAKAELHLRLAALYDAAKMKDKAVVEFKAFLAKNPDFAEKTKLEQYIKDNVKN